MTFKKYDYGVIAARYQASAFKSNHILVLDLDDIDDMLAAVHWVTTELKVGHALIASSANHFWLVVDFTGSWKEVKYHLETIPGVDDKFRTFGKHRKQLLLRAIPKIVTTEGDSYTDNVNWRSRFDKAPTISDPAFPSEHTLVNPHVLQWYTEFKEWYEGEVYAKLKKAFVLRHAAFSGTMVDLAQNPGFVL